MPRLNAQTKSNLKATRVFTLRLNWLYLLMIAGEESLF